MIGKHSLAKEHISTAITLLQEELLVIALPRMGDPVPTEAPPKSLEEKVYLLVIAYHNLGVENEFLKQVSIPFSNL